MRVLKWVGIVLGAVVVLAIGAVLYFKSAAQAKLDKTYEVAVEPIPIPYPLNDYDVQVLGKKRLLEQHAAAVAAAAQAPAAQAPAAEAPAAEAPAAGTGSADGGVPEAEPAKAADPLAGVDLKAIAQERALERGKHYIESRAACTECHAKDFGGKVVVENPALGSWIAPNISRGGVTKGYKPEDWVRLIRHCIKPDGRPATMPCEDFTWFSDQELSDIVAYINSMPAVDREMPKSELGPVYSMLIATEKIKLGADELDHTTPRDKYPPRIAATVELGKHLGATCSGCHGAGFSGGEIVGGDPAWPHARNITFHETGLAKWSLDDFKKALREGVRPDGTKIDKVMPIPYTSKLKDAEIEAIYMYLQTVEKKPQGSH